MTKEKLSVPECNNVSQIFLSVETQNNAMKFRPFSLNLRGRLAEYDHPAVMGILNVTPDSFYAGSRVTGTVELHRRVERMLAQGADIIDVGGYSSRPGADDVSPEEEMARVRRGVEAIRRVSADIPVSVDTFRADVARHAVLDWGADIVNDISGGAIDSGMFPTVAELKVPYVLMHMRGTPATMQTMTGYEDVTADVVAELSGLMHQLELAGVADIIIDPGFGFAKTLDQNYELMRHLPQMAQLLGKPVLVGISRKSMITKLLSVTADEALPGTVALNTFALLNGASILRVHDVEAAVQAVRIVSRLS